MKRSSADHFSTLHEHQRKLIEFECGGGGAEVGLTSANADHRFNGNGLSR